MTEARQSLIAAAMAAKATIEPSAAATPMMQQYLALRAEAEGSLLFYRMGDFFELFFEDARIAAACLDIALTARGEHEGAPIPMCGVPIHAAETYLARLIRAGHRVAIAEQVESPAEAKKRGAKSVVNRAIVRVVTAGTLTEEALLDSKSANWLVAVAKSGDRYGLAATDISTGRFELSSVPPAALEAELARLSPSEIIVPERSPAKAGAQEPEASPWTPASAGEQESAKRAANWVISDLFGALNRLGKDITESPVSPSQGAELLALVADGTLSGTLAKQVFEIMLETGDNAGAIVEARGLKQTSDTGAIEAAIAEVMAANADKVADYRGGKDKLFGFFVGQTMKAMAGKANPGVVNELLKKALG